MNNTTELLLSVMRQTKEYRSLCDGLCQLRRRAKPVPGAVTGLCEGAAPVFLTALASDETAQQRRVLLLYASEKDASDEALRLSEAGVAAYHFPARDYNFNISSASRDYEHRRLLVLSELLFSEKPMVVCATSEAALQVTVPPEELIHLTVKIDPNRPLDPERLSQTLICGGYTRVELVEGPGQFAVRGGIADIFPPAEKPYRIELFGDEIDRIGYFDPVSQRFTGSFDGEILIPPACEAILTRERREKIIGATDKQLKLLARTGGTDERASHAAQILLSEQAQIKELSDISFADKYLPLIYPEGDCLFDYFDGLCVIFDTAAVRERANSAAALTMQSVEDMVSSGELYGKMTGVWQNTWERAERSVSAMPTLLIDPFARSHPGMTPGLEYTFRTRHIPPYGGNTALLLEDMRELYSANYRLAVLCANEADAAELAKTLTAEGYSAGICKSDSSFFGETANGKNGAEGKGISEGKNGKKAPIALLYGECDGGYELTEARFAFLNYSGVSEGAARLYKRKQSNLKKKKKTEKILSYSDLTPGDAVVHEAYGVGIYEGIETLTAAGITRDYVKIRYAGTDKLFLPVDQLDLVSKYIGGGVEGDVKLSKMGGTDWHRAKSRATASAREMAKELISLYARRKKAKGYAFPEDDDMTAQFAAAFPYDETDSQLAAIDEIRQDMEESCPMERMVCGDVGYGKTEVALRAAFKAVMGGKQVAILVPTTILAYQHYQTALSRFRGFPVSIDMLSRFRTKAQQEASVRKLRRGETDIVIGTHRIISSDIEFHDLGLVIIDEEQRFGVAQKEKLKKLAIGADLLTLTATPIPRTLNMAMGGIVDMSILDDVPGMRSPVQTYVMEHDDGIITETVRREIRRGGQVFYLNNNIEYLYTLRSKLTAALPEARVAVAHGRMEKDELEDIWAALVRGEIDILVCTTIIETGVDVPNANTLIIENADRFGLSQLHQIRGRVGRSSRRAYAYFTYPKMKQLSEVADKRLRAMKEYAAFGAGFKIALRDLEIRGAGNLLGSQQHGHMEAVGYDMYMKLLEEAVLEEKGETPSAPKECAVNLLADAFLPKSYIKDSSQRMEMYRKIAKIRNEDDFSDIIDELCDRFGDLPSPALSLCRIALVRGLGLEAGFTKIEERERDISLTTETPNLTAVRTAEAKKPGTYRVTLGRQAVITVKKGKGDVCDSLADFLKGYIKETENAG